MELWDIYDKNRNKTGKIHTRGVPLQKGEYHLVVHAWIYNDQGQMLIQRRQPWKKGFPNMWDSSAAGSAISGDDSRMAVIREVKEELGLDLDMDNAKIIFTVNFERGFDDVWLIKQNVNIEDLSLQYEEVADAKWATREEIKEMISDGSFIYYEYLDKLFSIINQELGIE